VLSVPSKKQGPGNKRKRDQPPDRVVSSEGPEYGNLLKKKLRNTGLEHGVQGGRTRHPPFQNHSSGDDQKLVEKGPTGVSV